MLVGINLLREGLDLPEVSLVAILDADKEGYLRSATSLIQTAGRAPLTSKAKSPLPGRRTHALDARAATQKSAPNLTRPNPCKRKCQQQFSLCSVGLWPASTSLSRCSNYCADCCGASGSAGSRKLRARARSAFFPFLAQNDNY